MGRDLWEDDEQAVFVVEYAGPATSGDRRRWQITVRDQDEGDTHRHVLLRRPQMASLADAFAYWPLRASLEGGQSGAGDPEALTATEAIKRLREAIRLTREYVGERALPALAGWTWFDAVKATGGLEGFGSCGVVLDPDRHGRPRAGDLFYCRRPAGHDGDHGYGDA